MYLVKKCVLFLLLCTFKNSAYSQLKETFKEGTIEFANGEKLNGFIKDEELKRMANKIEFKLLLTDKTLKKYNTSQVKSFSLNNELFQLFHLSVNNLSDSISIFAKLVLKGKASLYKSFYNSDDLFIIKTEAKDYVLQNDKLENGTLATEVTSFNYKNVLSKAISESSTAKNMLENIQFSERKFIKIISEYNKSFGLESKLVSAKEKKIHFILANLSGMYKNNNENEFGIQLIYRTYIPAISKSTSINVGLNYFNFKNTKTIGSEPFTLTQNFTSTLASLPIYIQQNILNKNIRPYIFTGFNLAYYKVVDEKGTSQIQKGFQNNYGIGLLFGGGIEIDIYKGLMLKGEYRYEIFSHLVLLGIGYNFSRN